METTHSVASLCFLRLYCTGGKCATPRAHMAVKQCMQECCYGFHVGGGCGELARAFCHSNF
eukprot:2316225-Amphidinium_carterae.1